MTLSEPYDKQRLKPTISWELPLGKPEQSLFASPSLGWDFCHLQPSVLSDLPTQGYKFMERTEGLAVVEQQQPLADQVSAPSHWQGQEGCSQGLTPQWPGLLSRDPPLGPFPPGGRAMWAAPSSCVLVQWTPAPKVTQEHLYSLPQALFGLLYAVGVQVTKVDSPEGLGRGNGNPRMVSCR